MRFFVDTADVDQIRKANDMGVICGVTTNPSLIAKSGRQFEDVIKEIRDVVADDTVRRNPACFFHLGQDSPLVGFFGIPVEILFPVADLSGGNDSDPAFLCNGACQTAKADANAHSTLDQGKSRKFITDFKILHNDHLFYFTSFFSIHIVVLHFHFYQTSIPPPLLQ